MSKRQQEENRSEFLQVTEVEVCDYGNLIMIHVEGPGGGKYEVCIPKKIYGQFGKILTCALDAYRDDAESRARKMEADAAALQSHAQALLNGAERIRELKR